MTTLDKILELLPIVGATDREEQIRELILASDDENKIKSEAVRDAANDILGKPPLNDQYDEFMDRANKLEKGEL